MPNFAVKEKPTAIVAPIREPLSKVSDGTALNHYYHRSKTDSVEDVTAPGYFNWMRDTFRSGFKKGVIHYVSVHLGEIADGLTQVDLHVVDVPATFSQPVIMAVGNVTHFTKAKAA